MAKLLVKSSWIKRFRWWCKTGDTIFASRKIVNTHGIKGEVKAIPLTDNPVDLTNLSGPMCPKKYPMKCQI